MASAWVPTRATLEPFTRSTSTVRLPSLSLPFSLLVSHRLSSLIGPLVFLGHPSLPFAIYFLPLARFLSVSHTHSLSPLVHCSDGSAEETRLLVTGSSDQSTKLWDVESGQQLQHYQHSAPARWVNFAHGGKMFLSVTDRVMGMAPYIYVFKVSTAAQEANPEPLLKICGHNPDAKIFQAYFGPLNKCIYACNQDGSIAQYDAEVRTPSTLASLLSRLP